MGITEAGGRFLRRRGRRLASWYLVIGLIVSALLIITGWRGPGHRWAKRTLAKMERQSVSIERVERFLVQPGDSGLLRFEVDVIDFSGERLTYRFERDLSRHRRFDELQLKLGTWRKTYIHMGPTGFREGEQVFLVEASGAVAREATHLTAGAAVDSLRVSVLPTSGDDHRWTMGLMLPESEEERAALATSQFAHPGPLWVRLPDIITETTRRKRAWAAWIVHPAGYLFDAITWPWLVGRIVYIIPQLGP